ncbi:glycosyltransferase [Cytobacillus oceanisediminis]|uniref:glycosyltransferase n=1 Tax=Cytobacillus oceanisediminis TaxID=665099 RepID=UPI00203EBAC8|nr:glycosyltransferase [Cytobacillus oceanisediminis]MCM3244944.1 glycosyltransferase [Cytobacillus oceanisediminis]
MGEKVCMFVWNHFTNDARVLRECTSLSESGYDVDLVCIHDPKEKNMPYFEERSENFHIYRVKRYPETLVALQRLYRFLIKNKGIGTLFLILWILLCFYLPIIFVPATVLIFLILKTELKRIIIKGNVVVRMILRGFSKNYVIYHSNDLNTLPQGYICAKWRISRKKLIYDSHEVQTSRTGYDGPFHGRLEKFLVKKIDSMIVENHTRAKYNEDLYGFYPNVVHNYPFKQILNSNEKVDIHKLLNLPADEKILLYQGGIQIGRGLDKLIQAAPKFNEGTLVLIGDGKIKPQLLKMVDEMGLQEKVKFIPKVYLSELPKYTRNAYLGFQVLNNVCFNHYSASSNKLFEYMMAGVPVVACDFPEIKRVVKENKTGICIDSHDPDQIASAVNQLLADEEFHEELSMNSRRASRKYNWEEEKNLFLKIYNEFMKVR